MSKLKDCPECGPKFRQWLELLKSTPYPFSRRLAKRQLKFMRRNHSKLNWHDAPWKNYGNAFVSGCYKKTLLHHGGK